jgi:hypothetical protein
MAPTDTADPLMTIINALKPLKSDERHRAVDAAMTYLGETKKAPAAEARETAPEGGGDESYPVAANRWMKQNGVSPDELDQVFLFNGDGSFDIHSAPGKSKREQTLNTYILTGVGQFLATNTKTFADKLARGFCESIGCLDAANHAAHIKNYTGSEFSGSKSKGYTVTNVGLKRGAALVKELASTAK